MDVPRIAMHSLCPEHADVHESSNFSLLSALRGVNHKGRQKKKRAWLNKRKTASFVYRKRVQLYLYFIDPKAPHR
jgi:hypothetical protein